jgi:hypothetical protein
MTKPRREYVTGPDGSRLTLAGLPASHVRGGLLSREEACARYYRRRILCLGNIRSNSMVSRAYAPRVSSCIDRSGTLLLADDAARIIARLLAAPSFCPIAPMRRIDLDAPFGLSVDPANRRAQARKQQSMRASFVDDS